MVIKPTTLVVIATFAVVGAGVGAYWAVRANRAEEMTVRGSRVPVPGADPTDVLGDSFGDADIGNGAAADPATVFETEEIVAAMDGSLPTETPGSQTATAPETVVEPSRSTPVPPSAPSPAVVASQELARDAAQVRPTPTPSAVKGAGRPDGGAAPEGWERLERAWPSRNDRERPQDADEVIASRDVPMRYGAPGGLGVSLDEEPRPRIIEELVIPADAVIGLQVDTAVSTDEAEVEDLVEARVTRDVLVGDQVAVPAGSQVLGSVVLVEKAGRLKGAARLGVRFHTVVLDDAFELPISTETVYRESKGQGGDSAAKIGGAAIGGAILGAIFGGRQGAAIGGAAGAATGTAAAMGGDGPAAVLPAGSPLTIRLARPATITVEYE